MFDDLNDENVMLYAIKAYDSPNCIMSEFTDDMKRFEYLKRLFFRHRKTGEIRERLILNHIVVLCNVFGPEVATRLLFYKLNKNYYSALKTYLVFLSYMPERVTGIQGIDILSSNISINMAIAEELRRLK